MKFVTNLFSILFNLRLLFCFDVMFSPPGNSLCYPIFILSVRKLYQSLRYVRLFSSLLLLRTLFLFPSSRISCRKGSERYRAETTSTVLFRPHDVTVFWTNKSLHCRATPTTCYCFRRHRRVVRCNNASHSTETTNVTPTSSKFHTEQRMNSIELNFGNYPNGYVSCLLFDILVTIAQELLCSLLTVRFSVHSESHPLIAHYSRRKLHFFRLMFIMIL